MVVKTFFFVCVCGGVSSVAASVECRCRRKCAVCKCARVYTSPSRVPDDCEVGARSPTLPGLPKESLRADKI